MDSLDIKSSRSGRVTTFLKEYLESKSNIAYSSYNSSHYSYTSYYTVYFYEWSNINNRPRQFSSAYTFIQYLRDSNINYSTYQYQRIYDGKIFYCSCIPGKNELILCNTYVQLRERLENR